jgi:hypothetical protein
LFIKGLIYGMAIIALNTLVLHLTMKRFVTGAVRLRAVTFFLLYLVRYAVLGALIFVFLTRKWGSPVGLLAGVTVGLVGFMVLRKAV